MNAIRCAGIKADEKYAMPVNAARERRATEGDLKDGVPTALAGGTAVQRGSGESSPLEQFNPALCQCKVGHPHQHLRLPPENFEEHGNALGAGHQS